MALAERKPRNAPKPLLGSPTPRIGPPRPLRDGLAAYQTEAALLGIEPMPWQDTAARYLTAKDPDGLWLYREVAVVVGRQNGKTTLTKPLIVQRLKAGRHIMHIAQVRELPRIMFEAIADALESTPDLFPRRRGKIVWPRRGAGSESIVLTNGGSYRIAAAISGSARGHSIDDLLIDELREMESFDVVNSAKPAQRFSEDPQTIYLSNMGTSASVVLNSLIARAGKDPALAYLGWSADPEYAADDRRGWVQSNPAIGHHPQVLRDLETDYRSAVLGGNLAGFETEALCRGVETMLPRVVSDFSWQRARADLETPRRTMMGISTDAKGRASAALAWQQSDGSYGLRVIADVTGDPFDVDTFGADLRKLAKANAMSQVGYDDWTDKELAKFFKTAKAIGGKDFAAASQNFRNRVDNGTVHWDTSDEIGDAIGNDLAFSASKPTGPGEWMAVKANADQPITALLAAIRALWLASGPLAAVPRVM